MNNNRTGGFQDPVYPGDDLPDMTGLERIRIMPSVPYPGEFKPVGHVEDTNESKGKCKYFLGQRVFHCGQYSQKACKHSDEQRIQEEGGPPVQVWCFQDQALHQVYQYRYQQQNRCDKHLLFRD
jgi:hypothetical protein